MNRSRMAVRPISTHEVDVVRRALQSAPVEGMKLPSLEDLESLNVVSRCACGCASVDFKLLGAGEIAELVADAIGETSSGEEVGVLVFGVNGRIIGLEIVGYSDSPADLPIASTVRRSIESADQRH
jgi:hypothetical protein